MVGKQFQQSIFGLEHLQDRQYIAILVIAEKTQFYIMAHRIAFILLVITLSGVAPETITTATSNDSNTSFNGVDLASLLQSLGMTQNDLNNLKDSVTAGDSTAAAPTPPATASPSVSVNTTSSAATSGSVSNVSANQASTKTASTNQESFKLTDLSELQKQLGLDSKSGQSNVQIANPPAANPRVQTKPAQPANQVTVTQPTSNNTMPQANAQSTPTTTTQPSVNQPSVNQPSVNQPASSATNTPVSSSYDFLGQFNSMLTSNSAGVIPLNSPISSSKQLNSMPGFMDLTSLQEQLGLLSKPTPPNVTQTKSNTSQSASNSKTNTSNTSNQTAQSTTNGQTRPAAGEVKSSNSTSSAAISNSSTQAANRSAVSNQTTAANNISSINQTNTPIPASPTPTTDSPAQISSTDSKATANSDQASLLQNIADLQKLLDQLSSNNQPTNSSVGNASVVQPIAQNATPAPPVVIDAPVPVPIAKEETQPIIKNISQPINAIPSSNASIPSTNSISRPSIADSVSDQTGSVVQSEMNVDEKAPALIDVGAMTVLYSAYKDNKLFVTPQNSTAASSNSSSIVNANPTTSIPQPINNVESKPSQTAPSTTAQTAPSVNSQQDNSKPRQTNADNSQIINQPSIVQEIPRVQTNTSQIQPQSIQPTLPAQNIQRAQQTQPIQPVIRPTPTQPTSIPPPQPQIVISRLDPRYYQPNQIASTTNQQSTTINQQQQPVVVKENVNNVFVSPVPVAPRNNNLQIQSIIAPVVSVQSRPNQTNRMQSYQQTISSNLAVYSLNATYKQFAPSFILAINDPYLPALRRYLSSNYGGYLNQGSLISGFRLFSTYDDSIEYQLLYRTIYGTFNAILNYNLNNDAIMLKSLSVINFFILEVDVSNCQIRDESQNSCRVCNAGYRNFMGRCREFDGRCVQYVTDECGLCVQGSTLSRGVCV